MAIIALLMGVLIPALASSRSEGTKVKCLANLRSLGQGLSAYTADDEKGFTTPISPTANNRWYDGDFEFGGQTGIGPFAATDYLAINRPLNRYIFGSGTNGVSDYFRCPTDGGIPRAPFNFDEYFFNPNAVDKKASQVAGTSYRVNNHINYTSRFSEFRDRFFGPYMRPASHVPDPGTTVILEEAITEVAKWNNVGYQTPGWHRKINRFNASFIDGHASTIFVSGQPDSSGYEADYWILRGDGWRMDCYPRAPVCDSPKICE